MGGGTPPPAFLGKMRFRRWVVAGGGGGQAAVSLVRALPHAPFTPEKLFPIPICCPGVCVCGGGHFLLRGLFPNSCRDPSTIPAFSRPGGKKRKKEKNSASATPPSLARAGSNFAETLREERWGGEEEAGGHKAELAGKRRARHPGIRLRPGFRDRRGVRGRFFRPRVLLLPLAAAVE